MKRRRVTGLLMVAVLAISFCPGRFSAAETEPVSLADMEEISRIAEEIEPASGVDTDLRDGAAEDFDLPDEVAEEAITESDLPDDLMEEVAEGFSDTQAGFSDGEIFEEEFFDGEIFEDEIFDDEIFEDEIPEGEEAPFMAEPDRSENDTILVKTDPFTWGGIHYTRPDGEESTVNRIEGLPIMQDGTLLSALIPICKPKTVFSHWELNGEMLSEGTDCTFIDDNGSVGLAAIKPELLTGADILTAVFKQSQDDMVLDSISFRASEGGVLKAESWSEPYEQLLCYVDITDPDNNDFNTLYGRIMAMPAKGWRFIRWEDSNGEVISTNAVVSDLRAKDGQGDYASVFIRNHEASPFKAVFEELGTLTIKVSAKGAAVPATAFFTVTGPEGYEKKLAYSAFTDGEYTLEDLVPGTYTVKEDEASAALDSFELAVTYPENGEALITKSALEASVSIVNTYTEKMTSGSAEEDKSMGDSAQKELDGQILNISTEESPDALYGKLYFRVMGVGKHSIKLRWRKINGATGYVLYGGPCNGSFQRIGMVTTNSCTVTKLKKGTYYKFKLVAVKQTGTGLRVQTISKVVHEVTSGGKLGNPRGISFSGKKKMTLKKGKTAKINAKAVLPIGLKLRTHRKISFESSNTAVAKVNKKGKVKAVGKGKATIFVFAQNGICRQVKVRVR